jgi:PAS domain S-box-containing protein
MSGSTSPRRLLDISDAERYRCLAEAAFEGVVFTKDGIILDGNRPFFEMTGYDREALIGTSVLNLVAPEHRAAVSERIATQDETLTESQCICQDGSVIDVEVRGRMMRCGEEPVRVTAIRDISERKAAERDLRSARDRLRQRVQKHTDALVALNKTLGDDAQARVAAPQYQKWMALTASEIGMGILTSAEQFIEANEAFARLFGYDTPKALVGRSWDALFDAATADRLTDAVLPAARATGGWAGEISGRRADGASLHLGVSIIVMESGGLIFVCRDIAERKEAKAALQQYAQRLKNLREIDQAILSAQSPAAIAEAALERMWHVVPCIRSSVVLFDEAVTEGEVLAYFHDGDTQLGNGLCFPAEAFRLTDALRQGDMEVVPNIEAVPQTEILKELSEEGIRSYVTLPLMVEDQLIGILNIGADQPGAFGDDHKRIAQEVANQLAIGIRQARLLEQVQEQTERLEQRVAERTAELESFTYSVSHDLRTPLRAIDGFTRLLRDQYAGCLDDEGRRLLNVVYDSAQKMGDLIDGLLALSRMGRRDMRRRRVDMDALARDVADDVLRTVPERDIDLTIDDLPQARGDRSMLQQVFANLLSNAVKFTRGCAPARIAITVEKRGDEVVYTVEDNGAGFDMDYADKLFGVFQRLHDESDFEGTGVGLAIVERIVTRHDGRVWAEGTEGEGATFSFALPAAAAE